MHKKQINRLLATVLSIVMILSLVVIPASAAPGDEFQGKVWDIENAAEGVFDGTFAADHSADTNNKLVADGIEAADATDADTLTLVGKGRRAATHGTQLYKDTYVVIPVPGDCDIEVSSNYRLHVRLGEDSNFVETEGKKVTLYYRGEAGTVEMYSGHDNDCYATKIELKAPTAEEDIPVAKKLALDTDSVNLKMGETTSADVTVSTRFTTDEVSVESADPATATADLADGTITITAVAAGNTTVDVKLGTEVAKTIAVTVQPAGKQDVDSGVYFFDKYHQGATEKTDMNVKGLVWEAAEGGTFAPTAGHGIYSANGGTLTVNIPEDKYATLVLTTCAYGMGGPTNEDKSEATVKFNDKDVVGTKPSGSGENDKEFTVKNLQGPVVITFVSEVYVHGITVGDFTDEPVVDPAMKLNKLEVVVKVGGEAATITPTIENVDNPVVTATSADETIATVDVGADNTISVTAVAAGVTTVDVAVTGTELTDSFTVYVQPATIGDVKAGTYDFTGEDGKATWLTTADITFSSAWKYNGDEHGLTNSGADTIDVTIPADKKANVTLITCQFGGSGVTSTTGTLSQGSVVEAVDEKTGEEFKANTWTLTGVTGTANFTAPASSSVYIHGLKVELLDLDAATLAVSAESVTMREGESKEVTADATGYDATMSLFAISADPTKATVALDGNKITITGVAEGETTVYVGMAASAPADATAAAAVEGVKTVAVTVTPGLAEGTKEWVWGGKDGAHDTDTCEKDSEGLKFPENNKREYVDEDGKDKVEYVVWYHNHYGLLAKPRMTADKTAVEVPATIGIPVDGPSTITVEVGYTWDIMLGDAQNPSRYGTSNNGDSTSAYQFPVVFDYYGGAGYVTLTATEKTSSYIYSIMVEPKKNATANPKVAVWDLAGTQLDPTMFDNKITVETIKGFYPPSEQWPDPKVPTLASFATDDGEFAFVAAAETNEALSYNGIRADYRLRSGLAALKDWVHSTNNYTKSDIAAGEDPYEPTLTTYNVSFQSNGGKMTFKIKAEAGDKLTFAYANSGTADGAIFMDFIDAADADSGKVTKTLENKKGVGNGNVGSVYVTQSGIQTITHGPDPNDETQVQKPAMARFYRESPSKVTITGNLTEGQGVTAGYKLIATDDVSGMEYEATVADGQYSIEVNNYLSGTSFTLSVEDAEGCIVGIGEKVEVPAGAKSVDNDVAIVKVDLVTVSGSVTGLTEADLANLVIAVGIPEDKIYTPKIVPAADGTYTAKLEKDTAYTLEAKNVNDYELGVTALNKGADETNVDITFTKKPVYAVTITADPADVDMSGMKFTFTNFSETDDKHPDGYVYTFTGVDGIELRDGQYKVKLDGAPYPTKIVTDLKVNGAAASKTITFVKSTPTSWVFTQDAFTADVLAAKDFNMLKLDGDVRREAKDHAILGNGGKMSVPVDGPCRVDVTVYYAAVGTIGVGDDTVPLATDVSTDTTGATDTISYNYAGPGAGYVDVIATATSYITKIEVVEVMPYKATLTVGVDKDYQTIQAAVDAVAKMDRPDNERVTIVIDPGDYEEMVWVKSPNVTFKNAASNPSIALTNQGKDIDATGVRITWYYGCGFDYYSMGPNSKFSAEQLAVNKENGYVSHPNSAGGGSNNECWWNATTVIAATGFQAEGIIFENSFNQYVSAAAANDVIVPNGGAKQDNSKPRAGLPEGSTEVQRKAYVERAAAIALANNVASDAVFDNCAFVGHQDVIYGGSNVKAAFYDCDVYGACDYIFGPMTAVFAKCDLVLNVGADSDSNDVAYIIAPQNGSSVHGYLMYNCNVRNVEPGVENAGTAKSAVQHEFGRAWGGATAEGIFFETTVGTNANDKSLISPAGWNTGLGSSQICAEYHTHEEAADADHTSRIMGGILETPQTKAGAELGDYVAWLGGWDPFEGKTMGVTCPDATDAVTSVSLKDGEAAAEATYELEVGTPLELTVDVAPATAYQYFLVSGATDAITVTKGDGKITVEATEGVDEPVVITVTAVGANAAGNRETTTVSFTAINPIPATKVTVTGPEEATSSEVFAGVETTVQLSAAVEPADTTQKVTWTSSSEKVTVDETGKVTVPADATAEEVTITATAFAKAEDGTEVKTTYTVVIKDTDNALDEAIKAAEAEADAVETSEDGSDVSKRDMWVTPTVMEDYQAAIDAAKEVAKSETATPAEKIAAINALNAATAAFKDAQAEGTKKTINNGGGVGTGTKPTGTVISENDKGDVATTVTKPNGDINITVVNADGETVAEISLPAKAPARGTKFIDVPDDHWAAAAINEMADLGMVKGVNEDGTIFDMNSDMTRGSVATMFFRMSNGAKGISSTFADVAEGEWYADAVGWAAKTGVVNGYSAEAFGPNDTITREQLAVMLCRFANLIGLDTKANAITLEAFSDGASASDWAVSSLAWAVKNGVMKGRGDDTLDPTTNVTRAEATAMFDRVIALIKK